LEKELRAADKRKDGLDEFGDGLPVALLGGGDGAVGEDSVEGVDAFGDALVVLDGGLRAEASELW
jgi:hypothetical protein